MGLALKSTRFFVLKKVSKKIRTLPVLPEKLTPEGLKSFQLIPAKYAGYLT